MMMMISGVQCSLVPFHSTPISAIRLPLIPEMEHGNFCFVKVCTVHLVVCI